MSCRKLSLILRQQSSCQNVTMIQQVAGILQEDIIINANTQCSLNRSLNGSAREVIDFRTF